MTAQREDAPEPTVTAVCFVSSWVDLFLAVSRKEDPNAFGFPGGKVDPGETPAEAVVRELREETGLDLNPSTLREVYRGVCPGGADGRAYYVAAYTGELTGEISTKETGRVEWVTAQRLLEGPFSNYNARLFRAIGFIPV